MNETARLIATLLWRRLDEPGHDCCRVFRLAAGWRLLGMAVFREGRRTGSLTYQVDADSAWQTRSGQVSGFFGRSEVEMRIRRTKAGEWRVGAETQPGLGDCLDLDLGFTPATNLIALRRLGLKVGEEAEAPAAWLSPPDLKLRQLPQRYRRTGEGDYDYESPTAGYRGTLQVSKIGAVVRYPGLFELVV